MFEDVMLMGDVGVNGGRWCFWCFNWQSL